MSGAPHHNDLGQFGQILERNAGQFLNDIRKIFDRFQRDRKLNPPPTPGFIPIASLLTALEEALDSKSSLTQYERYSKLRRILDGLPHPDEALKHFTDNAPILTELFEALYAPKTDFLAQTKQTTDALVDQPAPPIKFLGKYLRHPESPLYKLFRSTLGFRFNQKYNMTQSSPSLMQDLLGEKITFIRAGTPLHQILPGTRNVHYNSGFLYYLWALKNKPDAQKPVDKTAEKVLYLHINLQKTDSTKRWFFSPSRIIEAQRSRKLHELNRRKGVHAITLPADNGFFSGKCKVDHVFLVDPAKEKDQQSAQDLFDHLKNNIQNNKEDFYFDDKTKAKLDLDEKLKELYENALRKITGSKEMNQPLTPNQRQAVLFCFIKGELTKYILETLQPTACSIACKDNIDRGGVHNAYFAMHQAFENDKDPYIDIAKWEILLKMPAMSVKGREINHHINALYNVLWQEYKQLTAEKQEKFQNVLNWLVTEIRKEEPKKAQAFFETEKENSSAHFRARLQEGLNPKFTLPHTGPRVSLRSTAVESKPVASTSAPPRPVRIPVASSTVNSDKSVSPTTSFTSPNKKF